MRTKRVRHIVDILLGIGLILLMSCQVVGEEGHEWTGIAMTALMLIHQVLNRKWYAALFKGKYAPLRIVQTVINLTLLGCFLLTAMSGINMGVYAIPSLAEFMKASTGRRMHLALSHWSFILMGLHLGLHVPAMLKGLKNRTSRRIGCCLSFPAAGAGLYFFLKNSFPDYLSFQRHFAFIDYEKPAVLVLLEALLIASFFAFVGFQLQKLLVRGKKGKACSPRHRAGRRDRHCPERRFSCACRAGTTTPFNTIHADALRTTRRASPSPASCQPLSCRVQARALTTEPALRRPSIRHTFPV